jgi:hypothetical protein
MLKFQYRVKTGRKLNLKDPQRYTEKIQWYKLYYKNPLMIQCVDKYDVRSFIEKQGYSDILVKCYGVFDSPETINFEELPNQFVMKSTLGGGGNSVYICKDKQKENLNYLIQLAREWITPIPKRGGGREWPYYSGKRPRIIIEEYLSDDSGYGLIDYKFTCFQGKACCIFVLYDRVLGKCAKMTTYDREFRNLHVSEVAELEGDGVPIPKNYYKMLEITEKIAYNFPLVRVDLYNVNGKTYFGELTFYDESGYTQFIPDDFDFTLGEMFKLPNPIY